MMRRYVNCTESRTCNGVVERIRKAAQRKLKLGIINYHVEPLHLIFYVYDRWLGKHFLRTRGLNRIYGVIALSVIYKMTGL